MMKKVNIVMKAAHLWTQEEEDRLTTRIVDNFCDLINRSEEEGLYWTGLKCDLIDLAHMVWETGRLMDKCGRPMDFQTIVHHICRVLHVREPCNPLIRHLLCACPKECKGRSAPRTLLATDQ